MKPHTVLHIWLVSLITLEIRNKVEENEIQTIFFLRQTFDSINYKNGHPKSRFVGSDHKKLRQRVECMQ